VPIIGAQELPIAGTLPRCVRVMLHIETELSKGQLRHIFLEGASALRPDLPAD